MVVDISKFFVKFFHCHKFQRLSNYPLGKIQLNATHWTPISNVSMPSLWFLPIHNGRVTNCTSSPTVGKRAETNFNIPAPPFNHISGICKNLAETWPAATRVLSRGRKREDPENEVANSREKAEMTSSISSLVRPLRSRMQFRMNFTSAVTPVST